MMEINFESGMWFDVGEDDKKVKIGCATSCGNYVSIEIRKSYPSKKHLKALIRDLNKLEASQ